MTVFTDIADRGLSERWYIGHNYAHTALWPGSVETHMQQATDEAPTPFQGNIIAWYERSFALSELKVVLPHICYS